MEASIIFLEFGGFLYLHAFASFLHMSVYTNTPKNLLNLCLQLSFGMLMYQSLNLPV